MRKMAKKGILVTLSITSQNCNISHMMYLVYRMKHEKETSSSILVQHLSFADMLMGVYLLIVVGGDEYYR